MTRLFLLSFLLIVTACGAIPVSPADVAALEEGVTIAERLALNYTTLPACPVGTPVCSVAATKRSIKAYAQTAHDAVKTLQASSTEGTLAAAQLALAALQASIPAMPVPATN